MHTLAHHIHHGKRKKHKQSGKGLRAERFLVPQEDFIGLKIDGNIKKRNLKIKSAEL